jgi:hypothetical protein
VSVALNVRERLFTVCVGVPEITPFEEFKDKPEGSVPKANDHEYGVVPPVAARLALYAVPTWPFGREFVVIASGPGEIVSVRFTVRLSMGLLVSVTLKVRGVPPIACVGIPEMAPVAALSERPAGSVPLASAQE